MFSLQISLLPVDSSMLYPVMEEKVRAEFSFLLLWQTF